MWKLSILFLIQNPFSEGISSRHTSHLELKFLYVVLKLCPLSLCSLSSLQVSDSLDLGGQQGTEVAFLISPQVLLKLLV